jgi:hypothetical protein
MIFTGKKKADKPVLKENPRPPRYASIARVGINGFEGEAVLRNISSGGFRMESKTYAAIRVGDHYTMQIRPEAASNLHPFELEVEVRWIQSTETKFCAGFLITSPPVDRSFEKYLDYIKTKNRE